MSIADFLGIMSILPSIAGGTIIAVIGTYVTQLVKLSPLPTDKNWQQVIGIVIVDYILIAVVGHYANISPAVAAPLTLPVMMASTAVYHWFVKKPSA